MTNKKFTENEIRKALLLCSKPIDINYCESCPLRSDYNCIYNLKVNALDLINRQKAQIEMLKECPKCVYEYDGEITEYCTQGPCANFKTVEQVKAETYREFAERLKKKISAYKRKCRDALDDESVFAVDKVRQKIDDLLKEMVSTEE